MQGNGWRLGRPIQRVSGFWQGVCYVVSDFGCHIRYKVYSCDAMLFWLDKWLGDVPLAQVFPALFTPTVNK